MSAAVAAVASPPHGWTEMPLLPAFSRVLAPAWTRGSGETWELGLVADERHANGLGRVHGGLLSTFADVALGWLVVEALGEPRCATASLQLHYLAAATVGAFVACRPEIVRATRSLYFVRGLITADGRPVASADGIWKVLEATAPASPANRGERP